MLINGMQYDRYNLLQQYGYGRQVGRNVLQLNNGNNTFIEIGQYAGIAATDWSWGSLIADFDNDGWKDIYIANGYRRDVANLDYLNYVRDSLNQTGGLTSKRFPDINDILNFLPVKKIANYLFINNKQLSFVNSTKQAGMDQPSFSNGSAFADLDRDGDLDLIVNNIEDPAFIYRNDITGHHWLQIDVQEKKRNTDGIGAGVDLYAGGIRQHQMLITNKGFFSSSEPILHFGLGAVEMIDSIILQWPEGPKEIMKSVIADGRITWKPGSGEIYADHPKPKIAPLFSDATQIPGWTHQENVFVDFKREKLLPYMISAEGPCISIGDVNGDKLDDIYVGNGSGFPSLLFTQSANNTFTPSINPVFKNDAIYEDCGSILEDMDGDGDKDLVVVSGGYEFKVNDQEYMVRYYVNDGKGLFSRSLDFPVIRTNAGAILAIDYDKDKDFDVIIAGRSTPGAYPQSPRSYLLRNDNGRFKDVTHEVFPALKNLGMIADIESGDLDGDQNPEIVFVGEWLPIAVFSFDGRTFKNHTASFGLEKTTGWWKSIKLADMDHDGDLDLFAGNIGLNNRMVTSEQHPVTLITKDFDGNGSLDPILCFYFNDKLYPYAGRDAIISQIPILKKKFNRYALYASATINDIFTKEELEGSTTLKVNTFQTTYLVNENKKFVAHPLPYQVQLAPVFDMVVDVQEKKRNTDGIGAGVDLYAGGIRQHQMLITNKGFFSSSEPILHFGLGAVEMIDSIILQWPEGPKEIMKSVIADGRITWKPGSGEIYADHPKPKIAPLFSDATQIPGWTHQENVFVDFKREKLLPYMISAEGPCISIGDVNGDKLDDIYVGNGSGFPSLLFTQSANNTFTPSINPVFKNDAIYEDCGSILEDMDGDGDKDLVVVSGGYEFKVNDQEYMVRYYVNDGKGLFSRSLDFPVIRTNAGAILAIDYDKDKDFDVIIAGRSTPGAYPQSPRSYLLRNDNGRFKDVTHEVFPALKNLGMIADIESGDLDGDQNPEIVFVGEWLPIAVFSFDGRTFKNHTASFGLEKTTGWWKSIKLADMDHDGDLDLFAGNIGLNNRMVTSEQHPVTLITKDFDGNGSLDPILCFYFNDKLYPYAGRDAIISQIPILKKKFNRYALYASATINDIFTKEELEGSTTLKVNTFQTTYLVNENKKFVAHPLPYQVQLAPVFDMVVEDFNQDGRKDVLMAGNFLYSETETGEMDAGNGTLLLQNTDGTFYYVPNTEHGFWAQDEVRELQPISLANGKRAILTGNNQGPIQVHALTNAIPDEE